MSSKLLQDETLAHKFIRRGSRGYIFLLFIAPVGYIVRLLVSNTISVEEIGVLYSIIGFVGLLSVYNDLGLTEALQYFLPKYRLQKEYNKLTTIFWLTMCAQIISSTIVGGLMRYWSGRLAINYFQNPIAQSIIQIYALYFLAINIVQALGSLLQAFQDTFTVQILEFCKNLILLLCVGGLRWFGGLTVVNVSRSQFIAQSGAAILSWILIWIWYGKVIKKGRIIGDLGLIKQQMIYARWIFLGVNVIVLFGQVDLQMILWFLGPTKAGMYTTYQSLYSLPIILIGPLYSLMFSTTTELHTKGNEEKIGYYLRFMCQYLLLFGCIIGGLFISCGPIIAQILFGSKFIDSGHLLALGSIFIPITILLGYLNLVVGGIGGAKYRGLIFLIALIVNILGNLLLIPLRGTYGAVIATGGARITMTVLLARYIYQRHRFGIDRLMIGKNIVIITILSISIYYLRTHYGIFINADTHRIWNLGILSLISLGYMSIITSINQSLVLELWRQVRMSFR